MIICMNVNEDHHINQNKSDSKTSVFSPMEILDLNLGVHMYVGGGSYVCWKGEVRGEEETLK